MASMLKKCRACGREVSKTAKACPGCGDTQPHGESNAEVVFGIIILIVIVLTII